MEQILSELLQAAEPSRQLPLKRELRGFPEAFDRATFAALRGNPFFEMTQAEIGEVQLGRRLRDAEEELMLLRQLAGRQPGLRVAVFAMPKSGSTFVQKLIAQAAGLPFLGLTSVAADGGRAASNFGINGREQELDELAIVAQTFRGRGRWIAQHHTRFTPYLGSQLGFYLIRPILTVRNVFDALVSMDDMLMSGNWTRNWAANPAFGIPADYAAMAPADRLALLADDYGRWLVKFLVSWKRGIAAGMADPLILSYERDILDKLRLAGRIADYLDLGEPQRAALVEQAGAMPGSSTRFNQGIAGRGAQVPQAVRDGLEAYARRFRSDLGNDGMGYLFGDGGPAD